MNGAYHRFPCPICREQISDAGFARASHAKGHARRGLYEKRTFDRLPWKAAVELIEAAEEYAIALNHAADAGAPFSSAVDAAVEYEATCKRVALDVGNRGALREGWI